ncbi:tyrosine-type recombinase/integrase [Mycolicibacterium psychrotolerans]|uniref:Putative prophage phiRv2 integrase n=1 Tax=Mycolicibacterium psychrotolerans TaxID=216929 RepID=A0A7I7MB17_9MYCO|nr:site-specific integrase [Mycolicibacterium psychrotolerans]BBX69007.1 putative prophage phiRv2 integrase [Mycolicibacterium psychrotolerans]
MGGKQGRRGWGHVVRMRSKRYQASYVWPLGGPRHYAATTYTAKTDAEHWLGVERRLIERGEWTPPAERAAAATVAGVRLAVYGRQWIEQRKLKPRTRSLYESQLAQLIEPSLGRLPVTSITPARVRGWYAALDGVKVRRNSQAYGLLHSILATAVKDGLLATNPCQIEGAMNTHRRREPVILSVPDMARLAEAAPDNRRALILLAAWCGLRWGEVAELRRRDLSEGCKILTVARSVTRRDGVTRVDTPKTTKPRKVVLPPHIREAVKHHLDVHVTPDADALLFPNGKGEHLNDKVFADSVFRPALKAIEREGVRVHDLRHFAGTQTARVGNLVETMSRLGHTTAKASLLYQQQVDGRDAVIADALSKLAEIEAKAHLN